jgi:hypothetical protein
MPGAGLLRFGGDGLWQLPAEFDFGVDPLLDLFGGPDPGRVLVAGVVADGSAFVGFIGPRLGVHQFPQGLFLVQR